MKYLKKNKLPILVLLLLITLAILYRFKSEKDTLQKNIDLTFTNAISDSMSGLSKDYSKIDNNQKIQYYYQTVTNLKVAIDVFQVTSYKDYDEYFKVLNRLYIYLLENKNENYEIDDKSHIFEFLGKLLAYPDDNKIITNFNVYLDAKKDEKEQYNDNVDKEIIDLTFTAVPKETLKESLPNEEWIKGKSIYFGDLENQIEATVHLYIDNGNIDSSENTIYGYIEHEGKYYEIGVVSYYGIDNVNVNLTDRNHDSIKEIEVVGNMGATYIEMKLITYNKNNLQWENLLTMGSPEAVDLDMDGEDELIAISVGSLPPFVNIYKWNTDYFEEADITESTESIYSSLYMSDGEWIIETGRYNNGNIVETVLYKYNAGKLIPK